jgi:GNAT superfamily N-acetyltransferase
MSQVSIVEVKKNDLGKFIDFPHDLYRGDKNYVPEIYLAMKDHLNKKKNPYFKHSDAKFFLAYIDKRIVGRICVTINNNYNTFHNCNVGFFGFFDFIEDQNVANFLLQTAENYCKEQGATKIMGPTNFSTNDTATVLVNGFDSPPQVQMTYNYPYYPVLLEKAGYSKEMDFFAYLIKSAEVNDKSIELSERLYQRLQTRGITIRNIKMKNWNAEVESIRRIYTSAWEKNWGFVPPTNDEFSFLAEGLKMVVDDRFAYIAEHNGNVVGFGVALPNINEIMINSKKGRLFPFTIFKLLFGKKKVRTVRIILLGVIEEYRKMGIEAVFFAKFIQTARANQIFSGEASWILENNVMMNQAAKKLNGEAYKTYRIYSKELV